ncbi:hypothetical protein HGRIS_009429 [Hohenbuehelia grisea]|uniref:Fungal-type protein kinase domain-containing protein n=1 Tax=Hohenbuehelia grisea TaxID=104357 RepID=A0ABR3J2I1_9AGAR
MSDPRTCSSDLEDPLPRPSCMPDLRDLDKIEVDQGLIHLVDDSKDFVEKMFPTDAGIIADIFQAAIKDGTYNAEARLWGSIPQEGAEAALQLAISQLFNYIYTKTRALRGSNTASTNPRHSPNPGVPKGGPDVNLAFVGGPGQGKGKDIFDYSTQQVLIKTFCQSSQRGIRGSGNREANAYNRDNKGWARLSIQVLDYMHLALQEQLDRRFIFGMIVSGSEVVLWLMDHSGMLGMERPINFHESPEILIRIVAGFATLPATMLGYDPDTELYLPGGISTPSYLLSPKQMQNYHCSSHFTQWVITIDGEKWVTTYPIAMHQHWRGHGLSVFAVAKLCEYTANKDSCKIHVFKQTWRSTQSQEEPIAYKLIHARQKNTDEEDDVHRYIPQCLRSGTSLVNGEVDETLTVIRQGLEASGTAANCVGEKRTIWYLFGPPSFLLQTIQQSADWHLEIQNDRPPVSRTRSYLLLEELGVPLTCFADLPELLTVILHALKGECHQLAWSKGILHRDISIGNIIFTLTDQGTFDRGLLIDFDLAVLGSVEELHYPPIDIPATDCECRLAPIFKFLFQDAKDLSPDKDFPREFFGRAATVYPGMQGTSADLLRLTYVNAATSIRQRDIVLDNLTPGDIGWYDEPCIRVDFSTSPLHKTRAGTDPFISTEVLLGHAIHPCGIEFSHDAVHDIESFVWVLLYICLTTTGPDSPRKATSLKERWLIPLKDYFTGPDIATRRMSLFSDSLKPITRLDNFDEELLVHFDPYYNTLKPLLKEWFATLYLAYHFRGYELRHIHRRIIELVGNFLKETRFPQDANTCAARKRALHERSAYVRAVRYGQQTSHQQDLGAADSAGPLSNAEHNLGAPLADPVDPADSRMPKRRKHDE